MTRRRCSGSRRADIAVESTRSQNITVRWRRSPSLVCACGLAVARGRLAAGRLAPERAARACFLPLICAPSTCTRIVAYRVRLCQRWGAVVRQPRQRRWVSLFPCGAYSLVFRLLTERRDDERNLGVIHPISHHLTQALLKSSYTPGT